MARRLLNPLDYAGEPQTREGWHRLWKAYRAHKVRLILDCLRFWGLVALLIYLLKVLVVRIIRDLP